MRMTNEEYIGRAFLGEVIGGGYKQIELLCREVERLREIVSHLPKTKDGEPIYPGRKVWVCLPEDDEDDAWEGFEIVDDISSPGCFPGSAWVLYGKDCDFIPEQCYAVCPHDKVHLEDVKQEGGE